MTITAILYSRIRGRASHILLEAGRKVRRSVESYHFTDFRNVIASFFQQPARMAEPDFPDKVHRGISRNGLHFQMQARTAHVHLGSKLIRREAHIIQLVFNGLHRLCQKLFIQRIQRHFVRLNFQ